MAKAVSRGQTLHALEILGEHVRTDEPADSTVAIAGKACETDILIWEARLPMPRYGDILATPSSGAYQYALSSNYLRTPRPAVVLVNNGQAGVMI